MGYCILFANGRTAFPDAIGLLFVVFLAAWAVNYVMKSSYSKKRAVAAAWNRLVKTLARDAWPDDEPFILLAAASVSFSVSRRLTAPCFPLFSGLAAKTR